MTKRILNRREFIRTAATAAASVMVVGGATTIMASNEAWAVTLKVLPPDQAKVLIAVNARAVSAGMFSPWHQPHPAIANPAARASFAKVVSRLRFAC